MWSILTAGSNLAASVSPILTTHLTTHYGWSTAFTFPGFLAATLSAVTYLCISDNPSDIGVQTLSKDQACMNGKPVEDHTSGSGKNVPLHQMLGSPFLWMLCAGYFLIRFIQVGINDWVQLYLMQAKDKSEYDGEYLTPPPPPPPHTSSLPPPNLVKVKM